MTRRIAVAILLTVWAMLIAGGLVAYFVTRTVLVWDFDNTLVARARALPQLADRPEARPRVEESGDDRWVIDNQTGANMRLPQVLPDNDRKPTIVGRETIHLAGGRAYRTIRLRFSPSHPGGKPALVVYSSPLDSLNRSLNELAISLTVFGALAGLAGAGAAMLISRRALQPLRGTAEVIGQIDDHHLDRRIEVTALPEELQPVAIRLNEMLARLEQAVAARKQFLADASHELRTPVAALVTTLEVALRRPRDVPDYVRALRTSLSDAKLLRELVQTLLSHARSEAAPQSSETFDLAALLNQCADVADGLAAGRNVTVARTLPAHLEVYSQPSRIRGIVMNLLGNAVEHNRSGGTVELNCQIAGSAVEISVSDTGVGIAADDLPHLFEPFYRARHDEDEDSARQHLGLGLFLVDSHIKALGGECRIESQVGTGTCIQVRLPGIVRPQPVGMEISIS